MTVRPLVVVVLALVGLPFASDAQTQLQDKFFDSNGVSIRYVDAGSGEPVVLTHGVGGSLATWVDSGVVANLSKDHRVIAFDARGHGKSGKPHDSKSYGREMPLDAVRLLDHLGIKQAHIVGYSMSGGLTSLLLTLRPERFLTATLVAGSGTWEWTPALAERAEREASERERECISRSLTQRLLPPNTQMPPEEQLQAQSKACMENRDQDRFALAAYTRAAADRVMSPAAVATVTVPTLGIVGNLDPNRTGLQNLKKVRPSIELVVIDGATHGGVTGIVRRPELLTNLRQFISAHRSAGTR
jgi:pimeloyl-ACP methyl ester carboxylesterase